MKTFEETYKDDVQHDLVRLRWFCGREEWDLKFDSGTGRMYSRSKDSLTTRKVFQGCPRDLYSTTRPLICINAGPPFADSRISRPNSKTTASHWLLLN